jgi:hypothetical protein
MCKAFPLILSSTTLIVVDSHSGSRATPQEIEIEPGVSEIHVRSGPIPLNRMDVTVRTERDPYSTSMTRSGSSIGLDEQVRYKAHEVSFNVDVESGPEK